MPNAIQQIRQAAHIISVVTRSGNKVLRLVVPIISVVSTVVQELRRKK